MGSEPVVQHWLVVVAREAGLHGSRELDIPSDVDMPAAWKAVCDAAGISGDELATLVAGHYGMKAVALGPDDDNLAPRILPGPVARRLRIVPVRYSDHTLTVASSDPSRLDVEQEVAALAGRNVRFVVAPPDAVDEAIRRMYRDSGDQPEPTTAVGPAGPRVLVVDDDADTRFVFRRVLEQKGFEVAEAPDGPEALHALDERPFDLITLDLQMHKMHGLDVLKEVRRRASGSDIPVVVATGSQDPGLEMTLFEAGADDYVIKPVDPQRFVLRIQAVLRRRGGSGSTFLAGNL